MANVPASKVRTLRILPGMACVLLAWGASGCASTARAPVVPPVVPQGQQGQDPQSYSFANPEPLTGSIFAGRPSFGTDTRAVPVGRMQVEVGYTYSEDAGNEAHSLPNTFIRTGLTDTTELRISTPGYVAAEGGEDGFLDVLLGVRFEVLQQDGWIPELSVQPSISLPTGDASGTDTVNGEFVVPMAWALDDHTAVNANAGVAVQTLEATRTTEVNAFMSLLLGRALSETFSVFAEYFAVYPGGAADQQSVDAGVTWLWNPNLQLDAAVGFGLNDAATDFFATFGVSHRF